jgi:hypothetical protein
MEQRTCGPDVDQKPGWIKMCAGTDIDHLLDRVPVAVANTVAKTLDDG